MCYGPCMMTIRCAQCARTLRLSLFYAQYHAPSCRAPRCKSCVIANVKVARLARIDDVRAKDRARGKTPERRARVRAYEASQKRDNGDAWRERRSTTLAAWRARNPEKMRAYSAVAYALRTGKLTRPGECSHCDEACKPQAHHHDYSKPLDVTWLCTGCHGESHQTP